jgi:spermidine/putrescine transport system substrate-binding protein
MSYSLIKGCLAALLLIFLVGCQTTGDSPDSPTSAPIPPAAPRALNIYNWDTYIDPAILDDFAAEFDVVVTYDIFENSEELLQRIRLDPAAYDLIVPTDYAVAQLRQEQLLGVLNRQHIPNFNNIDATFLNPPFDPGNRHCIPYLWGTMGVGYDAARIGRSINSWTDFFSPEFHGRIALMDSMRTTMGLVLLHLGYSPNTSNPLEIDAARDFLIELNEHVVAYAPDDGQDMLLDGSADLVIEWSGDILQLMEDNETVRYLIPIEGSIIWTDSICLTAGASNPSMAEAFINYLLRPEVGAALAEYTRYASPNQAAQRLVNPQDLSNPAIYPSLAARQHLYSLDDIGGALALYEAAWAAVLADFEAKKQ